MDDKLSLFKKQIGERHINEFVAEILKEKNFYRNNYETIMKDYVAFEAMKKDLLEKFPEAQQVIDSYEEENKEKLDELVRNVYKSQELIEEQKDGK